MQSIFYCGKDAFPQHKKHFSPLFVNHNIRHTPKIFRYFFFWTNFTHKKRSLENRLVFVNCVDDFGKNFNKKNFCILVDFRFDPV